MQDWYVGRQANFHQQWHQSYRHLLRTIDSSPDWSVARVIRYSKPISNKNDRYIYLGIQAATSTEATRIAKAIFDAANKRYQVGFGAVLPASSISDIDNKDFLIPTEFPLDGRIPVEPLREEEDLAGAFTYYDSPVQTTNGSALDPVPFDRFLQWLSAAGEGRWESFLRVARILGVATDAANARRLFRRLVLLGHIDSSRDGRAWSIAPPVIVQSAANPQSGFWCGCRSGQLLRSLPASWQASDPVPQPDGFGPAKRPIDFSSEVDEQWLSPSTEPPTWQTPSWGGPVTERLAALLPQIDEWSKTLYPVAALTPPDAVEQWDLASATFRDAPEFRIDATGRCHGTTGLYRLAYGEDPKAYHLTVFLDSASPPGHQLLRGEWYGLRFLALHRNHKYRKAMWSDEDCGSLAIPERHRWPLLFERVLVLASGFLPYSHPQNRLLYYRGIPLTLAQCVADQLGVQVETNVELASA